VPAMICERPAGNPLYVRELAADLLRRRGPAR
jgi:hypothetical protein